jgi:hypothetical protein
MSLLIGDSVQEHPNPHPYRTALSEEAVAGVDEIEVVLGSAQTCSKRAERRIPLQADEEGYQASKPKGDQQSYSLLTNG